MFRFRSDKPSVIIAALVAGIVLSVAGSVLATTIGDSISVTSTLSVTGASTLTGNTGIATSTAGSVLSVQGVGNFVSAATSTVYTSLTLSNLTATSTVLLATNTGFVGIATSSPGSLFSIQGVGNFVGSGSATSTLYSGLAFPGLLATSSGITVSGGNIVHTGANFVVQSNSSVGVSTSSPGSLLSIQGVANFTTDATSTIYSRLTFPIFMATSTVATSTLSTGGFIIGTDQFVVQQNSGSIGIGTTTPGSLFSIHGVANFARGATSTIYSNLRFPIFAATSTVATSTFSTGGLTVGDTQFVVQQNSGSIGIGTSTPGSLLSVQGVANFTTGATSTVYSTVSLPSFTATSTTATTTISTGGFQVGRAGALAAFTVGQSATTSVGVGTSTVTSHQFGVGGNALIGAGANGTSTLTVSSSGAGIGSCIQLRAASTSDLYRLYLGNKGPDGNNATGLMVEPGGCN